MAATNNSNLLSNLFGMNQPSSTGEGASDLEGFFETVFKISLFMIGLLGFSRNAFCNLYTRSMGNLPQVDLTKLTALQPPKLPSYFPESIVEQLKPALFKQYEELMNKTYAEYALCYSQLHSLSDDPTSLALLYKNVREFYHKQHSIHIGDPNPENRPALSSDFILACHLPILGLKPKEIHIHGPINANDLERINSMIKFTNSLTSLHLEVDEDSAVFFTQNSFEILSNNKNLTSFNITLMRDKRPLKKVNPLTWQILNIYPTCQFTFTNVTPPEGFVSNKLKFQ